MTEDYLTKSPSAGRMGKASELLVAALCILATRGELNVSTSLVDDEGMDLLFHRRGSSTALGVQVKSRMASSKQLQQGRFRALVQFHTFRPRPDLAMLFVAVDDELCAISTAWLIPSLDFATITGKTSRSDRLSFSASANPNTRDRWVDYQLGPRQLPEAILHQLARLERTTAAGG